MMGLNANAPIWVADLPAAWPDPPTVMTVTTLAAIESCPRRWALGAADYPELWSGRGYPPRVQIGALSGTVVHLTLEAITRALVRAGCPSLEDPAALRVMKDLGGYTNVVNDCIDRALELVASSPRAQRILEYAARSLRAQVPDLRTRAQTMLCDLRLPRIEAVYGARRVPKARGPLKAGVFPEIELRAEQLGWKGKADLLVLSSGTCEITDFKTGVPNEDHEFQIRVYALLWSRDATLNPDQRLADRLFLAYGDGHVEVNAPSEAELIKLERHLIARTNAALSALSETPPEAKPDPQKCRYCEVRHMCTEYWTGEIQRRIGDTLDDPHVADATITIAGRHGPSSWDAVVESSAVAKHGQRVLLRGDSRPLQLFPDQVVRLLSVRVSEGLVEEDSDPVVILTLSTTSEVFLAS